MSFAGVEHSWGGKCFNAAEDALNVDIQLLEAHFKGKMKSMQMQQCCRCCTQCRLKSAFCVEAGLAVKEDFFTSFWASADKATTFSRRCRASLNGMSSHDPMKAPSLERSGSESYHPCSVGCKTYTPQMWVNFGGCQTLFPPQPVEIQQTALGSEHAHLQAVMDGSQQPSGKLLFNQLGCNSPPHFNKLPVVRNGGRSLCGTVK